MQRTTLRASGVLLTALTIWALALVGWRLWRDVEPATAPGASLAPTLPVIREEPARVEEVLAANRLRLADGREVRLAAIEVPAPGQPFGEEGKQAARALAEGQEVGLVGPLDAALVYLPEGQLLQALLLSGGYARLAPNLRAGDLDPSLVEAEQQARDADLGVWRGQPVPTPAPTVDSVLCDPSLVPGNTIGPAEAAARVGETVNVVFLPPRATTDNGAVTLLAGVEERDFGVTLPAGLASTVQEPALQYLNRCLVANGRIERSVSGGPRIVLRTLDQLLVLR